MKTIGDAQIIFFFTFILFNHFRFCFFGSYFYFHLALKVDKTSKTIVENQKLSFPLSSLILSISSNCFSLILRQIFSLSIVNNNFYIFVLSCKLLIWTIGSIFKRCAGGVVGGRICNSVRDERLSVKLSNFLMPLGCFPVTQIKSLYGCTNILVCTCGRGRNQSSESSRSHTPQ